MKKSNLWKQHKQSLKQNQSYWMSKIMKWGRNWDLWLSVCRQQVSDILLFRIINSSWSRGICVLQRYSIFIDIWYAMTRILSFSPSLFLSYAPSLSLSLTLYPPFNLFVSLSLTLSIYNISVSHTLSILLTTPHTHTHTHTHTLYFS